MAVAPLGANPDESFEKLWELAQGLRAEFPHADQISAGMSADLEAAIRWGSTCVRVGSDIHGEARLPPRFLPGFVVQGMQQMRNTLIGFSSAGRMYTCEGWLTSSLRICIIVNKARGNTPKILCEHI